MPKLYIAVDRLRGGLLDRTLYMYFNEKNVQVLEQLITFKNESDRKCFTFD